MKKTLALFLAVLMLLSLGTTALAEDARPKVTFGLHLSTNVEDYDTNAFTKYLEDAMNIDIEFYLMENMSQKLPVLIASNEKLPDIIAALNR